MIIAWIKKLGNKNKMENIEFDDRVPYEFKDQGKAVVTSGMAASKDMSSHEANEVKRTMAKRRLFDRWKESHKTEYSTLKEKYENEVKTKHPSSSVILLKSDTYVDHLIMRQVL